jgi:EAL and modified HD-GYP domain-containing signal transduction protein
VRRNAEVKEIENVLKQDVALSYKLLRYINSAGFGLMCEIQSFRHAVTILGYEKLTNGFRCCSFRPVATPPPRP